MARLGQGGRYAGAGYDSPVPPSPVDGAPRTPGTSQAAARGRLSLSIGPQALTANGSGMRASPAPAPPVLSADVAVTPVSSVSGTSGSSPQQQRFSPAGEPSGSIPVMQPLAGAAAGRVGDDADAAADDDVMMGAAAAAQSTTAAPSVGDRTLVARLSFDRPLGLWLHKPDPTGTATVLDVDPMGQAAAAGVVAGAQLTRIGNNAIVQVDPATCAVVPVLEAALQRYIRLKAEEAAACVARGLALDAEKCTREFEFVLP